MCLCWYLADGAAGTVVFHDDESVCLWLAIGFAFGFLGSFTFESTATIIET